MADRMLGKTAVVTGAASGLGKAVAIAFLEEGAKIVATDLNEDRLKELKEEVAELGLSANLRTLRGNVCSDEDCAAAVQLCVDAYGSMNVLSHNAGIADDFTLVEDLENDKWDKQLAVNLTGSMKVTRAALRYFMTQVEANGGEYNASIVMITSNAAFESSTGGPAYTAAKAGANALMKAIAFEYKRYGIRCNSICPGPVLTNIVSGTGEFDPEGSKIHNESGYNAHSWEWTGGVIGMPEQISPLAVYLASDESSFMNGNSCVIDSGVCLSR